MMRWAVRLLPVVAQAGVHEAIPACSSSGRAAEASVRGRWSTSGCSGTVSLLRAVLGACRQRRRSEACAAARAAARAACAALLVQGCLRHATKAAKQQPLSPVVPPQGAEAHVWATRAAWQPQHATSSGGARRGCRPGTHSGGGLTAGSLAPRQAGAQPWRLQPHAAGGQAGVHAGSSCIGSMRAPQQQRRLHAAGPATGGLAAPPLLGAAACGAQAQQRRGLLGMPSTRPAKVNYQDHNTRRPERVKIKTRT